MLSAKQSFTPANISRDDTRPIKGMNHNDSLFFPKRVEYRQPVIITGLKAGEPRVLNFDNKIAFDLLVKGISADIAQDDGNILQEETQNYRFSYVQFIIQQLDKDTKQVLRTINIYLSSYPNYLNELILSPDYLYIVKTNQDVNSVALFCEPVMLSEAVVFYPPKLQDVNLSD